MRCCGTRACSLRSIPGSHNFSPANRSRSSRWHLPTKWRALPGRCWLRAAPIGRLSLRQRPNKRSGDRRMRFASVRTRTARVMTTLMRNGRDRRLGKPVMGHAIVERVLLFGTRSADYIRASGHCGRIATGQASTRKQAVYMAAPERFADQSDSSCNAGAVHTWPIASVSATQR